MDRAATSQRMNQVSASSVLSSLKSPTFSGFPFCFSRSYWKFLKICFLKIFIVFRCRKNDVSISTKIQPVEQW